MKASFLLRLSPVILLEPGQGLEGECALAGVVGSLWARLTLQRLGALGHLPQGHSLQLSRVWEEEKYRTFEGHSPFSFHPPSRSQEPPDSFLCSQNIPFASGVSEFSKPGPQACPNKSVPLPHPLQPPSPIPIALGQVPHRISSFRSELQGPS